MNHSNIYPKDHLLRLVPLLTEYNTDNSNPSSLTIKNLLLGTSREKRR
jgi:hypothetical protein